MDLIVELLKQVPAPAWSAIFAAIVTSGIAFLGVSVTNRENLKRLIAQHEHERRLRKDEVLRDRGEEIYVVVKKWSDTMISDHFPYVRVMQGKLSYKDALDMTLASGERQNYDPKRMHMICDIYFPELSKPIHQLMELNGKILDIREQFKRKYGAGVQKDERMAKIYLDQVDRLIEEADKLENQVLSAVRNS